jgi:signal transduction histidine kinase
MMNSLQDKNTMLANFRQENKRLELQFTQAQKLESLGVMAGGIAHDFNNMLTSILGYASLAMKKLPASSDVRKDLYMVMSGGQASRRSDIADVDLCGQGCDRV